ncbi:P-II family nitrogen regulator [Pectinatus frisingensis]|uniref:P-II family nitrogen regulator n=1 Tax=Pectinatus frisingensis TaxID=865 RepID=UPI0018C4C426|nr:P-II family nitrogen regulator [Pectinatus frisingensis]
MLMVKTFIRPEKKNLLLEKLSKAGFHSATIIDVVGRGKQQGIKFGERIYDEIPKCMLMLGIEDIARDDVINIILEYAKSGAEGAFGDGKIFISRLEQVYTVSSGKTGL